MELGCGSMVAGPQWNRSRGQRICPCIRRPAAESSRTTMLVLQLTKRVLVICVVVLLVQQEGAQGFRLLFSSGGSRSGSSTNAGCSSTSFKAFQEERSGDDDKSGQTILNHVESRRAWLSKIAASTTKTSVAAAVLVLPTASRANEFTPGT